MSRLLPLSAASVDASLSVHTRGDMRVRQGTPHVLFWLCSAAAVAVVAHLAVEAARAVGLASSDWLSQRLDADDESTWRVVDLHVDTWKEACRGE